MDKLNVKDTFIFSGYEFNNQSLATEEQAILTYHRIAEAMKFAYAKRTNLGDSDFVYVAEVCERLCRKNLRLTIAEGV